ncbi:hypothetical protein EZJ19_07725 [Parasulfuritortus cantonensis]|uniref:Uncharacterized protein n=1 Tax=Parasulfuritortus cantonensis TaxID=2528202 RepID=A0A4R1BDM9_9PROT|nr:hypothetical protein [Parasulfuritortus cantonensis]TCJ15189.1 hypothetical protein EZJ19_07725 [Parasulfuritortus cantonensis]
MKKLNGHNLKPLQGQRMLSPSVLLELYDEPVSFHRSFVELGGGVTAALFLSCACHEASQLPPDSDGWLRLSTEQWREATCLSRTEQETARRALRDRGLIEERRVGMPARLEIRVDVARLVELLQSQAARKYEGLEQIDYSAGAGG